jgi:hypothetical protein
MCGLSLRGRFVGKPRSGGVSKSHTPPSAPSPGPGPGTEEAIEPADDSSISAVLNALDGSTVRLIVITVTVYRFDCTLSCGRSRNDSQ